MMFSETSWAPANIVEMNERFEREYDDRAFERKIVGMLKGLRKRLRREDPQGFESLQNAIRAVARDDYYVLVMVQSAGLPQRSFLQRLAQFARLLVAVVAVICVIMAVNLVPEFVGVPTTKESVTFFAWVMGVGLVALYGVLHLILGAARIKALGDWVAKLFEWFD